MKEQTTIPVGIVDDHTLFRQGLVTLLEEYSDIRIVLSARSAAELQSKINPGQLPAVVLMDINMPQMDGHAATRWLKSCHHEIHVIALSMYDDEINIIRMLRNGAGGYVLKESNAEEVVRAIRTIQLHGIYLNELVSGRLLHALREGNSDLEKKLTLREREFLKLCCSDLTYKEIAHVMNISPRTIENYCEDLFHKLGVRSRTGLVIYALKKGIVPLDDLG